jgi:hypothetical protein
MLYVCNRFEPRCRRFVFSVRSSAATSPPAAMEQATPTSSWHLSSAPKVEAFSLQRMPKAAAQTVIGERFGVIVQRRYWCGL